LIFESFLVIDNNVFHRFLIAEEYMSILNHEYSIRDIEEKLKNLPKGLTEAYHQKWRRIEEQEEVPLIKRALLLVLFAKRYLSIEEFEIALTVREGDKYLLVEGQPNAMEIVSSCQGFIVIDATSQIIRLNRE